MKFLTRCLLVSLTFISPDKTLTPYLKCQPESAKTVKRGRESTYSEQCVHATKQLHNSLKRSFAL